MTTKTAVTVGVLYLTWTVLVVLAVAIPPWGYTQLGPLTTGYGYFLNVHTTTATSDLALRVFRQWCYSDSDCYIDWVSDSRCYCANNMEKLYNSILTMPCANHPGKNREIANEYRSMMMAGRAVLILSAVLGLICTLFAYPSRHNRKSGIAIGGLASLGILMACSGLIIGTQLFARNFAIESCYGVHGLDPIHYGPYFHVCWAGIVAACMGLFMTVFLVHENRKPIMFGDTMPLTA